MKKKLLTALIICAVSINVFAADAKYKYGVKLGMNISEFNNSSAKNKTGFAIGGLMNYNLSDNWVLQPELLYSEKGSKLNISAIMGNMNLKDKISYIDLPILFKYVFTKVKTVKPSLFLGPDFAFKMKAKVTGSNTFGAVIPDKDEKAKGFVAGLVFGGDLEYKNFIFDARYELGLTKASEDSHSPKSMKNRVFQFSVGYKFN